MSEENQTLTESNSDQPEPTAAPPAEALKPDTTADENMVSLSRFNEVNKQLKELKAAQEKAAKAQAEAERKSLEEQNNFKALYEKAEEARREAEARAAQLAHDSTRQRIASAAGQPELWDRLRGETEEELKADMEALLKLIPKPAAPSLNGGAGGGDRGRGSNAPSTAEIREQAARLGVDANLMAQQYGVSLQDK